MYSSSWDDSHDIPHTAHCLLLRNSFDAQIPESADLAADTGVQELIQSGDFMAVSCPSCGKRLTPEFPFQTHGVMKVGEIFLVPEADRAAFVRGRLSTISGSRQDRRRLPGARGKSAHLRTRA